MMVSSLAYNCTLKMEARCYSEILFDFQRTTRRYVPEDRPHFSVYVWRGFRIKGHFNARKKLGVNYIYLLPYLTLLLRQSGEGRMASAVDRGHRAEDNGRSKISIMAEEEKGRASWIFERLALWTSKARLRPLATVCKIDGTAPSWDRPTASAG
jgi:hypothetical protein